ncbi:hypothetical protein RISK_004760 [Rhodopirellula islandica]|uniref:Uncharacterized protein n=1 Tax=Rhodopirellula islandica TaxID=595434 RepID=A0A0J1BAB1_RHOIS|nr:hypothetical protein RISK_004760 [Rhodopirellula islandica]
MPATIYFSSVAKEPVPGGTWPTSGNASVARLLEVVDAMGALRSGGRTNRHI